MTPGIAYALMIVLSLDARAHPPPTWHGTREACWDAAPARITQLAPAGQPVEWIRCQRVRMG
jgi:hypothetical protein